MIGHPRRVIATIIVGLVLVTTCLFAFSEDAHAAIDSSFRSAGEHIDRVKSKFSDSDSQNSNAESSTDAGSGSDLAALEKLENATFFTLCRNKDLSEMKKAIKSVEKQFNSRKHYDWVFLNDEEFSNEFKTQIAETVSGKVHFGVIPKEHWSYPEWIDQSRAEETRNWMYEHNVVYGNLESYHHMCRYQSGFFFQHELLQNYKYTWRVEPNIEIQCKLKSDPFRLMRENGYFYGFNIAPQDIRESITSLWNTTKEFLNDHANYVHEDNLREFISDDDLEHYNLCHFWTNFEITDLDFLRSQEYMDYFNFLDRAGGFYYERWGDAPIRSIAASLFLPKNKIYFFNEIGYFHSPYGHCPYNQGPLELDCTCHPGENEFNNNFYDFHKNSCMRRYFKAKGRSYHDINPNQEDK